ncbi:DUF4468 domain-containing protein [Cyclobacterium xiamenense]|uniref:DUF4468 domain-containing protein n=1 Tax=Cyclobacterium xiamenense TaxID=1297121 RepID=UPI0012B90665|nr:DUF4468 domain-containing protein [Cyclobacterium xiamenense]
MTKRITLTVSFMLAVCSLTFGQDKFIYDQEGLNPKYVVVEMDSLEQNEIFTKAINWIKETYKNPDEVIKTTIDNEKVRFEGFKDNLICVNSLGMVYCYYGLYTIEIEFKDNKYKFTPLSIEYRVPASQYSAGGMVSINFNDGTAYYNKKGKLRKMYETIPSSIETLFNDLNSNLSNYLLSEKKEYDKDDW